MTRQTAQLRQNLRARIAAFPRVTLAHLPTPLERLSNLSRELGVNLFVKRDDQTGLALGGNKSRKLEFIIADALAQGADSIITWAGAQSNWCRQLTSAARLSGMQPFLVIFKRTGLPSSADGNLLLDELLGADITTFELPKGTPIDELRQVEVYVDEVKSRLEASGRKPYLAPIGGSRLEGSMHQPWGAMGYVNAMIELTEQAEEQDIAIDQVVFATSSGGTHAGLLAGARLLNWPGKIVGVSMSENREEIARTVRQIGDCTLELIAAKRCRDIGEAAALDEYVGDGYGILTPEIAQAIARVAQNEGLLLDPVYTGKAMAALLDLCAKGRFQPGENVVFLHTGGTPALFPYRDELLKHLNRRVGGRS